MNGEQIFLGYVWTNTQSLLGIAVHRYVIDGEIVFDVYYDGGHSDDELYTVETFKRRFGEKLYGDLEEFKRGNSIGVERVLV